MYNDFFSKITLVGSVLGCSAFYHLYASKEASEFSVRPLTFQRMAYSTALMQLHAGLSGEEIYTLVKQQGSKDPITFEDVHDCALGELVVLPNKKSVLALRTVLKLILEGHRYDPFTRVPFPEAFCEALSAIVSINCTPCTMFYDISGPEEGCYGWLLMRLCNFYKASYAKDAMCDLILRLQVGERDRLCRGIGRALLRARMAILGPTYNTRMIAGIFANIILAAESEDACADVIRFKHMLRGIQRSRRVSSAVSDVVRQSWIVPLERVQKALRKETLIAYGMEYERCLRNWRHWRTLDT